MAGGIPSETIREKGAHVLRLRPETGGTLILKLWNKPGLKGKIRRATRTDPLSKEVRALRLFHRLGIPVPRLLGYFQGCVPEVPCTGALLLEDLGNCITVHSYVKKLHQDGNKKELRALEDEIIGLTRTLVSARITDYDHTLVNMVLTQDLRLYRLDYELARRTWFPNLSYRRYGRMLSRLLASYTYAVQPAPQRVADFGRRLRDALDPSKAVLREANRDFQRRMRLQCLNTGIENDITFPW